jgi:NAD(P)-dependent dehydrogenase (short-subunit alcohol dehydrogenase family)
MGGTTVGKLENKVALVTGAGSGIGKAASLRFASEGAKVLCSDIDGVAAGDTADLIRAQSGECQSVALDVSSVEQFYSAISLCRASFGGLDVVFNNAGGSFDWDRTISVNLKGVYNGTMLAGRHFAENHGGAIVNTASIAGLVGLTRPEDVELQGLEERSAYVASKHGVVGLTRQFALTYARYGVRVNAIAPGYVESPMMAAIRENADTLAHLTSLHPMGRLGLPEEVAAAACFLASDDASFINGAILPVDGGYTAR